MEAMISMTGHVGADVESRVIRQTNTVTATFRLACTPRVRRRGEWADGETTWLTVTCYRALAENVAVSVGKGDPVTVLGKLRTQVWHDDNGERHERTVLEATSVGHDLARGTTEFRRVERFAGVEDDGRDLGELITSAEAAGEAASGESSAASSAASPAEREPAPAGV